jgi:hypothetical protein
VAGILANNENPAVAPDDFAFIAHFLYRGTHFHSSLPLFISCMIYLHAAAAGVVFLLVVRVLLFGLAGLAGLAGLT